MSGFRDSGLEASGVVKVCHKVGAWISEPIWGTHVVYIYNHIKGDEQPKRVLPTNRNIYPAAVIVARLLRTGRN